MLENVVRSNYFDYTIGVFLVLNAFSIGCKWTIKQRMLSRNETCPGTCTS